MEQQNNELIDQLISNQNAQGANAPSVVQDNDGQVLITTSRVVNIRYKIYVIILLVIIFFLGYEYIQPAYDNYLTTNTELTEDLIKNKRIQYAQINVFRVTALASQVK